MKSVELFAGAGGLALGTAEAGFHHKVVLEFVLYCTEPSPIFFTRRQSNELDR